MRLVEFASAADALELWKIISDNTWTALMQAIESDEEELNPTMATSQVQRPVMPIVPAKSLVPVSPSIPRSKSNRTTQKTGTKGKSKKTAAPKPIPQPPKLPKPVPVTKHAVSRQTAIKPQQSKPLQPSKPVQYPKEQGSKINNNSVNQKSPDPYKSDEKRSPVQADALNGVLGR